MFIIFSHEIDLSTNFKFSIKISYLIESWLTPCTFCGITRNQLLYKIIYLTINDSGPHDDFKWLANMFRTFYFLHFQYSVIKKSI